MSSKLQVLVVDDEPDMRAFLRDFLNGIGVDVLLAEDGQSALDLIQTSARIDVIIADYQMPRLNGKELFRVLSVKHPRLAERFIAMSSDLHALEDFEKQCVRLPKPFRVGELSKALMSVLPEADRKTHFSGIFPAQ